MARVDDLALLLGRLLIAALFLPSGISKLMTFSQFAASLGQRGVPYPDVLAGLGVAVEVLGPIALILGIWPRLTALAMIAFVASATLVSHRYWEFTDEAARRAQEINFYKNLGIIGGLLFYFAAGSGAFALRGEKVKPASV